MAENPLLPNAELLALLAEMKRCAKMEAAAARKAGNPKRAAGGSGLVSREALLAGTTMQLRPGDLLVTEPADAVAAQLGPRNKQGNTAINLPALDRTSSRLLIAVAMAAALRGTGSEHVVLAYVRARRPEPVWATALTWAQEQLLPLILVCADASGPQAFQPAATASKQAFGWKEVQRAAAKVQLPILTVDGEDGVAVYRVMQESVLRARAGGGPAILWAMLPSPRDLRTGRPNSAKPITRLQRYLRMRNIGL